MKILYVRLKNYIGLYQGTGGIDEIYVDFTKAKNRIILIEGRNGGGKSTLLNALNPFPDPNNSFVPDREGEKEISYEHNGMVYVLNFFHPVSSNGNRVQTKAYIKKKTNNGVSEYNPTGNITSFKDILDQEFGLDPNFIELSRMSTEDKGIVDKTPAERIRYVMNIVSSVSVYNNINKVLTKRASVAKSLVNNIVSKIDSIGDEESLNSNLISIEKRLASLYNNRDNINKIISEAKATIKVLDPDMSIQTAYENITSSLKITESDISYISSEILKLTNMEKNTEDYIKEYSNNKILISKYANNVEELEKSITSMLNDREEESRAMQLKNQRLISLQLETPLEDIKKSIKLYNDRIEEYEEFFSKANIKNVISISKDEYVTGLHILKDIKEMIDAFTGYSDYQIIIDAIQYIQSNISIVDRYNNNLEAIESIATRAEALRKEHYYFNTLLSKISILNDRPSKCKIDTCPFIKDSLEALAKDPQGSIDKIELELNNLKQREIELEKENEKLNECISAMTTINIIIRNINNNKPILNKLPNGYIFSDQNEFLKRLSNGDNFEDIDKLYEYISYANIFDDYRVAKDTLYKLNTDYTIYESKNEIIIELSNDIESITTKLNNITDKITNTNSTIEEYNKTILELENTQSLLDTIISLSKRNEDLLNKKKDLDSKLHSISSNMDKINMYIDNITRADNDLDNIVNEIKPLEEDKDKIKYGLNMLVEYKEELKKFSDSYNLIEILRSYSNPTKKGIQNLFIKVYMNDTLKLTNELLSYLFDGRMQLLKYNIGENGEFSIPCISMHTGMVTDDISSCSRSEKSMISMILGFVLLRQSATVYNVLRLDEVDEGLDVQNRLMFIENLNRLLDILNVEQCIMVSHTSELSGQVDRIRLEQPKSSVSMDEDNVIFSL